jgi:xenotropic and polytropic retrovirus receptor 1
MWAIFRVENEHCANVARFKASRDVPLPYSLSPNEADTIARPDGSGELSESAPEAYHAHEAEGTTTQTSPTLSRHRSRTAAAEEGQATAVSGDASGASGVLRRRAPTRRLTTIFAEAHTQDFEKRRSTVGESNKGGHSRTGSHGSEQVDAGQESSDADDDVDDSLSIMSADRLTGHRSKRSRSDD